MREEVRVRWGGGTRHRRALMTKGATCMPPRNRKRLSARHTHADNTAPCVPRIPPAGGRGRGGVLYDGLKDPRPIVLLLNLSRDGDQRGG